MTDEQCPRPVKTPTVSILPARVMICEVGDFTRPTLIREANGLTVLYLNYEARTIRI